MLHSQYTKALVSSLLLVSFLLPCLGQMVPPKQDQSRVQSLSLLNQAVEITNTIQHPMSRAFALVEIAGPYARFDKDKA